MAITAAELVVLVKADLTQLMAGLAAANAQLRQFAGAAVQTQTVAAQQIGAAFSNASSTVSVAAVNMTKSATQAAAASAAAVQKSAVDVNNGIVNIIGKISITNKAAAAATAAALTDTERAAIAAGQAITTNIGGPATAAFRGLASTIGITAVAGLAMAAVFVGLGYAIERVSSIFAKYGFEIYKMAQVTGIGAQNLQVLGYAATLTGSNLAGLQRGLIYLSKQMELGATGNKAAIARFHELGVETSDYKGKADALLPVLEKIAQKFEETTNGYQKAALASKLLSRFGGSDLIVMFNELGGNLRPFMEDLKNYGLLLDDEGIAKSKVLTQESIKLEMAWKGLAVQLGQQLYPTVLKFIGALQDLIAWFDRNIDAASRFATALQNAANAITGIQGSTPTNKVDFGMTGSSATDWVSINGVKYYEKIKGDMHKMQGYAADIKDMQSRLADIEQPGGPSKYMPVAEQENSIKRLRMEIDSAEQMIRELGQVAAANQGGTGTLGDVSAAKKAKNDGSEALRKSAEALAKQDSDAAIKAFKEQMEDEKSIQDEAYADRSISAATYYDRLRTLAIQTYQAEEDAILRVVDVLKNDQFAAQEKVNAALETGNTAEINKALTQLNEINSKIAGEEGKLSDAYRQTQQTVTTYYKEATKAALEFKKAVESENEELLKTQGGTATFQAQRLAAEHEYAEFTRKWYAEYEAAAKKINNVEDGTVNLNGQIIASAAAILAIKKQEIDLAEKAYLNQFAQNSAAQDELYIRQKISLGLISDQDADQQLLALSVSKEQALETYIAQFKNLNGLNQDQVLALKAAINELNKLKEMDLSPLQRLFKGLIDNTKTFSEQFADAAEQLGKDLHSSLSTAFQTLLKGDFKGFLNGMLTGFRDAIAKMVADLLASQLLKILANILQSHFGVSVQLDSPQTVAVITNTAAVQAATDAMVNLDFRAVMLDADMKVNIHSLDANTAALHELAQAMMMNGGGGGIGGSAGSAVGGAAAGAIGFFGKIFSWIGGLFGGSTGITIGNSATGNSWGAGSMSWVGEQGPELAWAMPGGGMKIYSNSQSKQMASGGAIEIHNHYWNVQTPSPQAFAGRPSQLQVERQAAQSVSRGRKNS